MTVAFGNANLYSNQSTTGKSDIDWRQSGGGDGSEAGLVKKRRTIFLSAATDAGVWHSQKRY